MSVSIHKGHSRHQVRGALERHVRRPDDQRTVIHEHGMSNQQVRFIAQQLFRINHRPAQLMTPATLTAQWCGDQLGFDDTEHQVNNAFNIKLVYAYAKDQPNQFSRYANLIADVARTVSGLVEDASAGKKAIRWDFGTRCGPEYVDIMTVRLPRNLADYTRHGADTLADRFFLDIHNTLTDTGAYKSNRNFLVFADRLGMGPNLPGGQGEIFNDRRKDGNNNHTRGGRVAVLYGRDGDTFFVDSWGMSYTYTSALHEVMHTLGAVQLNSPNTSGAFHCNDGLDIMCYADGGPLSNYTTTACPYQTALDCRQDDYFNPNPPAGSYLSANWNTYDSPFLCTPDYCTTSTSPPQVQLVLSSTYVKPGGQVTATAVASDDGPSPLRFLWDLDNEVGYETDTGPGSSVTMTVDQTRFVGVRVVDAAGAMAETETVVYVTNREPPVAKITRSVEDPVPAGYAVTFSSAGSHDPDGYIQHRIWRIDGEEVARNRESITHSFDEPGTYMVELQVTDNDWMSASYVEVVSVVAGPENQPPTARLSADRTTAQVGEIITLSAAGSSDPDGRIVNYRFDLGDGRIADTSFPYAWPSYSKPGSYLVRLTVTDDRGARASTSLVVQITPKPPPPEPRIDGEGGDDPGHTPPPPPPQPQPDPDTERPARLNLAATATRQRKRTLSGGLEVRGTMNQARKLRLEVSITPAQARKAGVRVKRTQLLARRVLTVKPKQQFRARVRLRSAGWLRRLMRAKPRLQVRLQAQAGSDQVKRSITLY